MWAPNTDALDEFLELIKEGMPAKEKPDLKTTQKKELELWHAWNTGGRKPELLKPLYESYKPAFQRELRKWKGVEIPASAIQAEIRRHFVNAVKTYDPKKAQLNTHVNFHFKKVSRFIKTYQNYGKMSEGQISKIREFKQGVEHLTNLHGYTPDTRTIADHLKWPHKTVVQLHKELSRRDLPVSGFPHEHDPIEMLKPRELEAVRLLQFDSRLSTEERTVYEHTFGLNGKSQLQPGQIAKATGMHLSKVSRIRNKLKGYVKEALDVV